MSVIKSGKLDKAKLDKAKSVIRENYDNARYGIFCTRNIVGDSMHRLYESGGLTIDICYDWGYFEVFGLSKAKFAELRSYYDSLENMNDRD